MDVLHALLSFARSEEYVGVLLPNEELRGRLSMLGEEDDGDILPVMVVVILLQHVSSSLAIRQNFGCVKIRRLWIPQPLGLMYLATELLAIFIYLDNRHSRIYEVKRYTVGGRLLDRCNH